MDYQKVLETRVGIFVAVGLLLVVIVIMMLGGDRAIFRRTETLHMRVDETLGLNEGAVVQLAGVSCGNVSRISFDNESMKLDIFLKVDRKFETRITKGSTASIRTQGALGDKFVSIKPGPFSAPPLPDGSDIAPEEGTDLLSTLGKSGGKFEKIFDILDHFERITGALDEGRFSKNVSDAARHFRNSTESLDELLASLTTNNPKDNKLKKSLDHLASVMEKIDSGQGTLGGLINDPTIHEDLKSVLGGAKRSKLLKYLIRQTIQKGEEQGEKGAPSK